MGEASWVFHFREAHNLPRDRFLGGRLGPWPQPAADSPMGMAAEVLHPLDEDKKRWNRTTLVRYIFELVTKFPVALWHWWVRHDRIEHLGDGKVARMMTRSSYSKFLRPRRPAQLDQTIFRERLGPFDRNLRYLISDFTTMALIKPYRGIHVAPTVSLFSQPRSRTRTGRRKPCRLMAIAIGHPVGADWRYVVLKPGDGAAWTLAKYFVIQGAGHMICLNGHPASHFPYDTVNAVTTSALPMDHTLFRLLKPHLDLHLAVDRAVLEGGNSIVSQTRGEFYAPFAGPGPEVRKLVPTGYAGFDPPHGIALAGTRRQPKNYGRWMYPTPKTAGRIPSDYGIVLRAYYATIRRFVAEVVAHMYAQRDSEVGCGEQHYIRLWADYIAPWLPGFPDGGRILAPVKGREPWSNLTDAVTTYIWDVAVAHSLEHATFHRLGPLLTSFRIRVPPPTAPGGEEVKRSKIVHGWDIFKATLAFHMFFKPHVIKKLIDVEYDFPCPALQDAVKRFHADLAATEQRLIRNKVNVARYIRYDELSSSIQY
jgi:hypothetical protein